ncbi:MAG: carboxypeptidase-like regulatory domain-containing protein [Flavobacterium sp.]|nr:MAG: carboxypeptidase-like regulatory domain-containing protein [Flavobacterium sp.]
MKKIFLVFLIIPIISFAQIKITGKILDTKSKQPIPYVNLESFSLNIGAQTNQDGKFELNLPKGKETDIIKISCVGYLDKNITNLSSANGVTYELIPVVFQLDEVNINKTNFAEKEIGITNKSGHKWELINQRDQRPGLQKAVYLKNMNYVSAYLKTLHFFMGDDMFDAPFRVRIYDDNNGVPGKDLLDKSIEFTASKKKSWNAFGISEYHILMPENGLWIAVEWIKNDRFSKVASYKMKMPNGSLENKTFTYYGPEIVAHFDTDFGYTYYKHNGTRGWLRERGSTSIGLSKKMRQRSTAAATAPAITVNKYPNPDVILSSNLAISRPLLADRGHRSRGPLWVRGDIRPCQMNQIFKIAILALDSATLVTL